jgi:Protein of unknown function (DUF3455)
MKVTEREDTGRCVSGAALSGALLLAGLSVAAISVGCAASKPVTAAAVPDALRPPAEQVLLLETFAKGVQIYQCTASADPTPRFEWKFKEPEAQLFDRSGRAVGTHFAGPTWKATDGSEVVGEVRAHDDGPVASAIPWLLLRAKSTSGRGIFSNVASIQRLNTTGGKPASERCGADNAGQLLRVSYTANYVFYASKP